MGNPNNLKPYTDHSHTVKLNGGPLAHDRRCYMNGFRDGSSIGLREGKHLGRQEGIAAQKQKEPLQWLAVSIGTVVIYEAAPWLIENAKPLAQKAVEKAKPILHKTAEKAKDLKETVVMKVEEWKDGFTASPDEAAIESDETEPTEE